MSYDNLGLISQLIRSYIVSFFKESIVNAGNQGHEYLHIKKLIDRSKKFAYEQVLQHFKNTMSTIPRGVIDCYKKIGRTHNL